MSDIEMTFAEPKSLFQGTYYFSLVYFDLWVDYTQTYFNQMWMTITSCNEHLSEFLLQLDETLRNKFNDKGEGFNQIITC